MSRREFLRTFVPRALTAPLVAAAVTSYPLLVEPVWLDAVHVRVPIPGLPQGLAGLRVAQFSDVHLGPFSHEWFLTRAVHALLRWQAHLIVFTGDMVTRGDALRPADLAPFTALRAPLGVWGVLGNHDHWSDADRVHRAVEQHTPIRILRNQAVRLTHNGTSFWLVGVDDAWVGADDPEKAFAGVPEDEVRIVLMHEPDAATWLPFTPKTLQLSGHSHGGQVRLPLLGPLILPYLGRKYDMGLFRVRGGWVYTNRGLGVIAPPIRLNCRPEITLLELQPA